MYLYWFLLGVAILAEVIGTTSMKLSDGFTKTIPSVAVGIGYLASGILLTFAIKRVELSIAYAVWAGLGVMLTTIIGIYVFRETLTVIKVISTLMIVAGVVGLYLSQPSKL